MTASFLHQIKCLSRYKDEFETYNRFIIYDDRFLIRLGEEDSLTTLTRENQQRSGIADFAPIGEYSNTAQL